MRTSKCRARKPPWRWKGTRTRARGISVGWVSKAGGVSSQPGHEVRLDWWFLLRVWAEGTVQSEESKRTGAGTGGLGRRLGQMGDPRVCIMHPGVARCAWDPILLLVLFLPSGSHAVAVAVTAPANLVSGMRHKRMWKTRACAWVRWKKKY